MFKNQKGVIGLETLIVIGICMALSILVTRRTYDAVAKPDTKAKVETVVAH